MKIVRRAEYIVIPTTCRRLHGRTRPVPGRLLRILAGPELRWALIGAICGASAFALIALGVL